MKRLLLGLMVIGILAGCHTGEADVPILIAPEDGAVITVDLAEMDTITIFQWETNTKVTRCYLQIATEETFYPQETIQILLILEDSLQWPRFTYRDGLWTYAFSASSFYEKNALRVWYWRVFAYEGEYSDSIEVEGWSDPSKVWSFELVKE